MKDRAKINALLNSLPDGTAHQVQVGIIWTAVVIEVSGVLQGGMAASLQNAGYEHARLPAVNAPGELENFSSRQLAGLIESDSHTEAAIGLAAINALLPHQPERWIDLNAADYLIQHGAGKNVAVVGHFHFVERLRPLMGNLWVLELCPRPGDLPAEVAPEIIPQADVIAITATTLINHTFEDLIALRNPAARVLVLGPSTPLSPVLFDWGVDVLSGVIVEDPLRVAHMIAQGGSTSQFKHGGIRPVTMVKEI